MAVFQELLAAARAQIREVSPAEAAQAIQDGATLLDVREPDEVAQGAVPNSVHIVRGNLEPQVEARLSDKTSPLLVMCAGGTRSALAAVTLAQLGYQDVRSVNGGFNQWKQEGREWEVPKTLTPSQRRRYSRHVSLPEVGHEGQQKLLDSKVLVIGAGGLGSPASLYLAAAGVGTIGIVDDDVVDESNLQRQVLHTVDRVGKPKVDSARQSLAALNPGVDIVPIDARLDASNIVEVLSDYDVVVDGADNFPTRYLLNDASVKLGIPVVHGSIFRFEGQASVFDPKAGPTYRDLLQKPPGSDLAPNCAEAGVLGVLPGIIGSIQATETIKILLGLGGTLVGRLLVFDALEMSFSEYRLDVDPDNEVTFANRHRIELVDLDGVCAPQLSA